MTVLRTYSISMCRFLCFLSLFFAFSDVANAADSTVNGAVGVLCDIISLMRGRLGRGLMLVALFSVGWNCAHGNLEWKRLLSLSAGAVIFFNAEGIAYLILPSTMKGLTGVLADGTVLDQNKEYSPQEFIPAVCPALAMY